jgi:superfamily II DNA or RNA helicase
MVDQNLKQRMLGKLERYISSGVHGLRDHQTGPVNDTHRFLSQPNQEKIEGAEIQPKQCDGGSIHMATGTGKSHVELETAVGMCQPTPEDPEGQRAIIISPRIAINSHIKNTYTSPQGLHCSPDDIGVYDSTRSPADQQHALRARYLITTREGFRSLHDRGLISPDPNNRNYRPLVMLDESDTFTGYEIGRILRGEEGLTEQQLRETTATNRPGYIQNSIVLGYTATDYGVNHHLFGDQPTIHSLPLVPAVRRGLLARGIKSVAFQVTPDDQAVSDYVRTYWQRHHNRPDTNEGGEQEPIGSLRAAEKYAMDRAVINEMIRFHSEYVDSDIGSIRNLPTLITAPTIQAADRIAERFNDVFGAEYALSVNGNTPRENKRDRLTGQLTEGLESIKERFNNQSELNDLESGVRKRAPRILVFPDVLGRGVDIRNATVLLSCRNYMTPTLAEQHLGRVTREQDENFYQLCGCDKVALAANFNLPGIRPWRFRDITGEQVVYDNRHPRRPARRGPPPPPPPLLPESGQVRSIITEEQWHQLLAEEERASRGQVPQGWYTLEQAAQITQLPLDEVLRRARSIVRNKQYTPDGLSAKNGESTVTGSELKRTHERQIILSDTLVQAWKEVADKGRRKLASGQAIVDEIAATLDADPAVIREILRNLQQEAEEKKRKATESKTTENLGEAKILPQDIIDRLRQQEDDRKRTDGPNLG